MGYATDKNGNVLNGNLQPIQIPLNSAIPGEATKNGSLSGNIPLDWGEKDRFLPSCLYTIMLAENINFKSI